MRVLEISRTPAAAYAGLLLAQLGCEVDRVNLAQEDVANDPFLHRGKRGLDAVGDLTRYDAIVEDVGNEMMAQVAASYRALRRRYPELVLVSLSPFGQSGPMAGWEATELTMQAAAGVLHCSGYREEPPRKLPGDPAAMIAGLHGATAVMSGVHGVHSGTESGVHIDISAQDTLMHHWTRHVAQYEYSGYRLKRERQHPEGLGARHTVRAADGWVYMLALYTPWQDVAAFLGLGEYVQFSEDNRQPWREMEAPFLETMARKSKYEWFEGAAAMGWTFAPVEDPFDVMNNAQSAARGAFQTVDVDGNAVRMPRMPFTIDDEVPDDE